MEGDALAMEEGLGSRVKKPEYDVASRGSLGS